MLKRRYSFFMGPSGPYTTQDATVPSPAVWLMSKHSSRARRALQAEHQLPSSSSITPMSARRARRMRSAWLAFSTVIAIQRAGSARDGRHNRKVVPARSPSAVVSASASASSRFTRISAGGGVLGVVLHEERGQRFVGLGQRTLREVAGGTRDCAHRG